MQASDDRKPHIAWKGVDKAGYFRGLFRDGGRSTAIGIAIPGMGDPAHPGPLYDVYIAGEKAGSMPNLKSAQALAELHLLGAHTRTSGQNVLMELGLLPKRRGR